MGGKKCTVLRLRLMRKLAMSLNLSDTAATSQGGSSLEFIAPIAGKQCYLLDASGRGLCTAVRTAVSTAVSTAGRSGLIRPTLKVGLHLTAGRKNCCSNSNSWCSDQSLKLGISMSAGIDQGMGNK